MYLKTYTTFHLTSARLLLAGGHQLSKRWQRETPVVEAADVSGVEYFGLVACWPHWEPSVCDKQAPAPPWQSHFKDVAQRDASLALGCVQGLSRG